jgi:hypothetical protein
MSLISLFKKRYTVLLVAASMVANTAAATADASPFGRVKGPNIQILASLTISANSCIFDSSAATVDFGEVTLDELLSDSPKREKTYSFKASGCSIPGESTGINIDISLVAPGTADWNGTPIIPMSQTSGVAQGLGIALYLTNGEEGDAGDLMSVNTGETKHLEFAGAKEHPDNVAIYLRAVLQPLSTDQKSIVVGNISSRAWLTMTYL